MFYPTWRREEDMETSTIGDLRYVVNMLVTWRLKKIRSE